MSITMLFGVILLAPAAGDEVKARGARLFVICGSCHGAEAEGSTELRAPRLAGQAPEYLLRQLNNFGSGLRAKSFDDENGMRMRPMASHLPTTRDREAVAAFLSSLPAIKTTATNGGDPVRGKGFFTLCMTCHGPAGAGNPGIGSPRIAGQYDWYIVGQLTSFRRGLRGAEPGDTHGAQMAAMAKTLPDDQAVRDVAAYVAGLE